MKSEKAEALESNGSNTDLNNKLTMNNSTPTQNNFQPNSRRDLLESTKLSRMPKRKPFVLPDFSIPQPTPVSCINCSGRLDSDDTIQQSVKVCRKCLIQYAKIDAAIDEASKQKRKQMLEKMAGGATQ